MDAEALAPVSTGWHALCSLFAGVVTDSRRRREIRRHWLAATTCLAAVLFCTDNALAEPSGPLARGVEALESGDYEDARRALRLAIRTDPESAPAHYYLGLTFSRQASYADAIPAFERALDLDPDLRGAALNLGIAHYRSGDYAAAAPALERAVEADPEDGSALLFVGLNHQSAGDHDAAIAFFDRARRADPDLEQLALYNTGLSHWKSGRTRAAADAFRRVVESDPDTETADAARRLMELAARREEPPKRWSVHGRSAVEYSSDVTQSDLDVRAGEADVAGVFDFGGAYRLVERDDTELEASYDFFRSLYADLDEFDTQSHSLGLRGEHEFGAIDGGLGVRFSHATLDGDKLLILQELRPTLGFATRPDWYTNVAYRYQHKDFARSARDADQSAVGFDQFLFFANDRGFVSLGYRLENEDADGPEFDYLGHALRLGFETPITFLHASPELELGYEYLRRDYDHVTPSIGFGREDRRHTFRVEVSRRLTRMLELGMAFRHVESASNLPSADYSDSSVRFALGFDL